MAPLDENFRIIADTAPVLIWISGTDKGCTFFNKGWLQFTGRTAEQELGNGWTQGVHPDDLKRCLEIYEARFDRREPFEMEYRLRRHDGVYRYIVDKGVPRFDASGEFLGYIGTCMDVHDRHELGEVLEQKVQERTEELRQQRDFSELLFESSVDLMVVYDRQMNFVAVNPAAYQLFEKKENVIGQNLYDIFPDSQFTPENQQYQEAWSGKTVHIPLYQPSVGDLWLDIFITPLRDHTGEVTRILLIGRDITGRVRSEQKLQSLNDKLLSKNRELQDNIDELASFNYVASHDLQEPLRKVNMFASRILETDGKGMSEVSHGYFDRINSAIRRMQNLIAALLEYSRMDSQDVKKVRTDLNKILREVLLGLEERIKAQNASVAYPQLPTLPVIPIQFNQLLSNLLSNSLKYSKKDVPPEIVISADEVEHDGRPFWKLSVRDNGIGFDMAYQQKIFELFQRLHGKTDIEGTGIGLAICRKIAHNHDGFITATSEVGKGSEFSVYLPAKK